LCRIRFGLFLQLCPGRFRAVEASGSRRLNGRGRDPHLRCHSPLVSLLLHSFATGGRRAAMTKGDGGGPQGAHQGGHRHNLRMYVSRLKIGGHRKGDKERNDELPTQPVNARLNALFNSQSASNHTHIGPGPPLSRAMSSPTPLSPSTNAPPVITVQGPELPQAPTPLFLKVRIVTWNMNDSVPKVRGL